VETNVIHSVDEVPEQHGHFAGLGYEGIVLRAMDLMYESNRRSLKMRKHKHFTDAEFEIVGVDWDEGVDREQFQWKCSVRVTNEDGTVFTRLFNAKPRGTREQKWEWFDSQDDYIGKRLTVRYQSTSADVNEADEEGIVVRPENEPFYEVPRFPIGIAVRDYE
jgi:ATP-dependent DNA ligase